MVPYGLGIPMVISMRGALGEGNPAQVPMGRAVRPLLDALGLQAFTVRSPDEVVAAARGVIDLAEGARASSALILESELGGRE